MHGGMWLLGFQACPPLLVAVAGMTRLWQVSGRNRLTSRRGPELDVEHVRRGFGLDLVILVKTAHVRVFARDAL